MMTRLEKKCYDLLLDSDLVQAEDLDRLSKDAAAKETTLMALVIQEGLASEAAILKVFSEKLGMPIVNVKQAKVGKDVFAQIPVKFAWYYRFFPYALNGNKLTIAVSRLVDVNFIDEVRVGLGKDIEVVLAPDKDIEAMLQKHYGLGADTVDQMIKKSGADDDLNRIPAFNVTEVQNIENLAQDASVIQLVNQILLNGHKKNASDIHLEPMRGKIRLRYRIDGVLHEAPMPPEMKKFADAIVSRIKIMANLNVIEKRLPQDGKARVQTQQQTLDLRVSSIPTSHGESIVVRLLPSQRVKTLDELGLEKHDLEIFKGLLKRPNGIIFVTGPTGSGKSTTLYAGLSSLNTDEKKIITIEDPVEYEMDGMTQIQVQPQVGLDFAKGLKSVLRHDPDVMMIGEVRDLETADIAIRIALTGHLILSTLHTNDAASGVTRLLDIGVEPYQVSSSVIAFVAQRLVRMICPECKQEDTETLKEVRALICHEMNISDQSQVKLFKGKGCDHCNHTGFVGRVAIYEFLQVDESIRKLIFQRVSAEEIKKAARKKGMLTLRQNGWLKVLAGLTTAEEVIQVSPVDEKEDEREANVSSKATRRAASDEFDADIQLSEAEIEKLEKMEINPYVERRAYERVTINIPLTYRIIDMAKDDLEKNVGDQDAVFFNAITDDISANGLSFSMRTEHQPGETVDVRITLPGQEEEIQCVGRIMRVIKTVDRKLPTGGFVYQLGITFLAINSTDRSKIEKFCKSQSEA